MGHLTRDAILAADDIVRETVKVPEWGGEVIVSTMSGSQRDAWEQSLVGPEGEDGRRAVNTQDATARLLAFCIVDDKGATLFTPEDIGKLAKKSSRALNRLGRVAQRLNGLGARDLEEQKKN